MRYMMIHKDHIKIHKEFLIFSYRANLRVKKEGKRGEIIKELEREKPR